MEFSKKAQKVFGDWYRRLRLSRGFTQGQVAEEYGYSTPQYVSNIERGIVFPSKDFLQKTISFFRLKKKDLKTVIYAAVDQHIDDLFDSLK